MHANLPSGSRSRAWFCAIYRGLSPLDPAPNARPRPYYPFVVLPVVSGPADPGQADPAVVRRIGWGMDDMSGVLPAGPAAWLHLCALAETSGLPSVRAA